MKLLYLLIIILVILLLNENIFEGLERGELSDKDSDYDINLVSVPNKCILSALNDSYYNMDCFVHKDNNELDSKECFVNFHNRCASDIKNGKISCIECIQNNFEDLKSKCSNEYDLYDYCNKSKETCYNTFQSLCDQNTRSEFKTCSQCILNEQNNEILKDAGCDMGNIVQNYCGQST